MYFLFFHVTCILVIKVFTIFARLVLQLKPYNVVYSIGGFESNFHQSFKKCSILTPDIKNQPQPSLESI